MGFIPSETLTDTISDLEKIGNGQLTGIVIKNRDTDELIGIATSKTGEELRAGERRELVESLGEQAEYAGVVDPEKAKARALSLRGLLHATELVPPIALSTISKSSSGIYGRTFNSVNYGARGSLKILFSDAENGALVRVSFDAPPGIEPVEIPVGKNVDALQTIAEPEDAENAVRAALEKTQRL
jgi:hypothetical protein